MDDLRRRNATTNGGDLKAALLAAARRQRPKLQSDTVATIQLPAVRRRAKLEYAPACARGNAAARQRDTVFISYARADETKAETLRNSLSFRGVSIWWDRELRAGEPFDQAIEVAMDAARAAIVIWSPAAVRSRYVRDEAARALNGSKLISTCTGGFDLSELPLGHGQLQTIAVTDLRGILRALQSHGILAHD